MAREALPRAVLAIGLLLVFGSSARAATPALPVLQAKAAILVERDVGVTLFSQDADEQLPIASTTKLMTAYVALQRAKLDRILTVRPYTPAPDETIAGLRPGERLSVATLLTAMLLPSGGDAAHTLAYDLGGGSISRFVGYMNSAALALGMTGTSYSTPVGLDTPGNHSSPADLALLAEALMRNAYFAKTVDRPSATLRDGRHVTSTNDLVEDYSYVVGIKTGHTTDAGYCLVGAASNSGANFVSVVLGDPSEATRDADTLMLLRYGMAVYHHVQAVHAGHVFASVPVVGRPGERLKLVAQRSLSLFVPRTEQITLTTSDVAADALGPLPGGTRLGEVVVRSGARLLGTVPLVSRDPIAAPPPSTTRTRVLEAGGLVGGVLLVVGCSLQLMFRRRRGWGNR
ncbi:MAG TPA: D-alanyl-D-alanine carboxypeptidase family protein [Solirubrobacteraceae bacterium]|nr:D-alanyl-D-alanine carboxypeptidase family protein [Solirubrobacteraceae bacterium]